MLSDKTVGNIDDPEDFSDKNTNSFKIEKHLPRGFAVGFFIGRFTGNENVENILKRMFFCLYSGKYLAGVFFLPHLTRLIHKLSKKSGNCL